MSAMRSDESARPRRRVTRSGYTIARTERRDVVYYRGRDRYARNRKLRARPGARGEGVPEKEQMLGTTPTPVAACRGRIYRVLPETGFPHMSIVRNIIL